MDIDVGFLSHLNFIFSLSELRNNTNATEICHTRLDHYRFYQYTIIPAAVIAFSFSLLKQRRHKFKHILHGRPAFVHPMDALTTSASISYVAAFGSMIFLLYEVIFNQEMAFRYQGPLALKSLIVIVSMLWYGLVYFPIFASLSIKSIFSYGVGSLYVWAIAATRFYKTFECDVRWEIRLLMVVRVLPNLLCLTYLSISLPVRFIMSLKTKKYFIAEETDLDLPQTLRYIKDSYQGQHVQALLKKPEPEPLPPDSIKEKIKLLLINLLKTVFYHNEKGFRYSTRILSVLLVGVSLLYVVAVEGLVTGVGWTNYGLSFLQSLLTTLNITEYEPITTDNPTSVLLPAYYALDALRKSFIISVVFALVLSLIMILHTLSSYRSNLHALYRGDYSHIPDRKDRSNPNLMVGCMRFAGYQVGYIAWGFLIQFTVLLVLCLLISIIVILANTGVSNWFVNKVIQLWPIFAWTLVLNIAQMLLAKFLFLQRRGDTLSIDNRRFFFIFTYFMFFFNIFLGLFSCLMRIIKAVVLGALFISRLDHSSLSQSFQFFDPGFAAYVGFIHVENQHTHPVMIVFIRLMLMNLYFRKLGAVASVDLNGSIVDKGQGRRAFNLWKMKGLVKAENKEMKRKQYKAKFNWLLFYTLINNPQIRVYRKGYIQIKMKAMEKGIKIPVSDLPTTDLSHLDVFDNKEKDEEKENGVNASENGTKSNICRIIREAHRCNNEGERTERNGLYNLESDTDSFGSDTSRNQTRLFIPEMVKLEVREVML